ncbi:hypothetical protein ACFWDI_18960 [Streptomyces sp. NPDC060064]|uniref:hypothetical protein n=1 Tax=Streptomyces sp. NPDC060064 TaxID=3347049 RepID=UPI0036BD682D
MSITIPSLRTVRTLARHAGKTPGQLKETIARLTDDNAELTAAAEDLTCAMSTAFLRGCQDSMRIARLEAELAAAVAEVKQLQQKTYRDAANLQRLRQAVINARPLITSVTQRLDRPYVSHVQLPYPVPVGRDMSSETTQELPILDQPEPTAWPTYRMRNTGVA